MLSTLFDSLAKKDSAKYTRYTILPWFIGTISATYMFVVIVSIMGFKVAILGNNPFKLISLTELNIYNIAILVFFLLFSFIWANNVVKRQKMDDLIEEEVNTLDFLIKTKQFNFTFDNSSELDIDILRVLEKRAILDIIKENEKIIICLRKDFIKFYIKERHNLLSYIGEIEKEKNKSKFFSNSVEEPKND
jgi:hypothetical protein